jgi:hypothetical protein
MEIKKWSKWRKNKKPARKQVFGGENSLFGP